MKISGCFVSANAHHNGRIYNIEAFEKSLESFRVCNSEDFRKNPYKFLKHKNSMITYNARKLIKES